MNVNRENSWYAVYTRPRSEKKAADTLSARGIETYCPVQKVRRQWHDRVKVVVEPVFRSYVFVRVEPAQRVAVLEDPNVLTFVSHCGKPAVIRDVEMEAVKFFLQEYEGYSFRLSDVEVNDSVRITAGPFQDYTGIVVKKRRRRASVRIELFNAFLVAEFEEGQYAKA